MEDKTITPGEAIFLLNNLPTQPPHGVMPTAWRNHRKRIIAKLQQIVDTASREADYEVARRGHRKSQSPPAGGERQP